MLAESELPVKDTLPQDNCHLLARRQHKGREGVPGRHSFLDRDTCMLLSQLQFIMYTII